MDFKQIQIAPFNSSLKEQRYLLTCGDNFYETGEHLAHLVETLQNAPDEESGIQKYVSQSGGKYTTEQIRNVVKNTVYHLLETKEKKRVFIYEKQLLCAEKIDLFSQRLSFLFSKAVMSAVFAIGLMLDIYYFVSEEDLLVFNNAAGLYTVTFLLAFTVFSSFFHELGHAAACKHFGIRHGAIGFGLYLNFPVLYTDVTKVWSLNRLQRCIVNIAGVYFQFLLLIPMLLAVIFTSNDVLRYMVLTVNLGFIMTLNPFFKFDGYWLMTDILGVANLRKRSGEVLAYIWGKTRGMKFDKKPYLFGLRPVAKIGFVVYSIVVNVFMGYYFLYIIPKFLYGFFTELPGQMSQLAMFMSSKVSIPFSLVRNIGAQFLFFALVVYMIWNMIKGLRTSKNAKTIS